MQNNYNSSDSSKTGATEVARLMKDVGTSVHMIYQCGGSWPNFLYSNYVENAFSYYFGYSSGGTKYNYIDKLETINTNLLNNQPVIFTADDSFLNGHAWVGDGFIQTYDCVTGYIWLFYHMNWGWGEGIQYNGWYGINDWTPGTYNFDSNQKVIVNIHP